MTLFEGYSSEHGCYAKTVVNAQTRKTALPQKAKAKWKKLLLYKKLVGSTALPHSTILYYLHQYYHACLLLLVCYTDT